VTFARRVAVDVDGEALLRRLLAAGPVVFEGAQGVLLDERYGFHPHVTRSTTTPRNALDLLAARAPTPATGPGRCWGVTRTYADPARRRPLVTEDGALAPLLPEPDNGTGAGRGGSGSATSTCGAALRARRRGRVDALAVTHLDRLAALARAGRLLLARRGGRRTGDPLERLPVAAEPDLPGQRRLTALVTGCRPVLVPAPAEPAELAALTGRRAGGAGRPDVELAPPAGTRHGTRTRPLTATRVRHTFGPERLETSLWSRVPPGASRAVVEGVPVDTRHWIGGRRVASAATFTDVSPIDERALAEVSAGGAEEVDAAVRAARDAFPAWAALPVAERSAVLRRVADGVEARIEDLSRVETRDNGSLLRSHRRGVMPRVAANFRFFADFAEKELEPPGTGVRGHRERVTYDPAGVVAVITPWNAPLMLATWRIGPALAAGDTVVLKPPEWAPLTASLLADVAHEAGLPPGVLNVVQGTGGPRRRRADPASRRRPDRVHRLGPDRGGRRRGGGAERRPAVVRARRQVAAAGLRRRRPRPGGGPRRRAVRQRRPGLPGGVRVLVEASVAEEFQRRVVERASRLRQGDPADPDTDVSALVSRAHFERVRGFVERARAAGARPVLGGGPNAELGGLYFAPTILVDATPGSEILTEEVFGPVLTVQTFADEAQAVAMANDTAFGLAATLVTGDRDRAERVSHRLRAGTVWVNCFFVRDLAAPFGGSGRSGSAARAACGRSTSTATSRTPCSPPRDGPATAGRVRRRDG
jgi:5-carboxymethyl-2-hydroxymuconic-semialdehyde dehydrogenase